MNKDYKIQIRGISGWRKPPVEEIQAEREAATETDLSTPEARLAALRTAARNGKILMANDERGGFRVQWTADEVGFGELAFIMNEDGSIEIDDEAMSREFCQAVLLAVLQQGMTMSERADAHGQEKN